MRPRVSRSTRIGSASHLLILLQEVGRLNLRSFARLIVLSAGLGGCGQNHIGVIDILPTSEDASVPDAPQSPPKPQSPTAPPPPPDRGRVQVRDGNLLSDKGTRLRGVTFGIDAQPEVLPLEPSFFEQISHEAGLNAIHVFLENYLDETGVYSNQADALVELTSGAGMYLVLGIGAGNAGGSFNIDKVRSFWTFYARRYAARTHVLFDIHNFPDSACDAPYRADTLAMEREAYELIRSAAPNTHVTMLSLGSTPTASSLESNLVALDGTVDWVKASVAFSTLSCGGTDYLTDLLGVTRARGIAAISTYPMSVEMLARLETERTGWFSFDWLVFNRDLAAFRDQLDSAGITWCPDFGSWPEDSQTCSTP